MILAGDIGGTNTRLGLFEAGTGRPRPMQMATYSTAGFPGLEEMVERFIADHGLDRSAISSAAFGVAGPVRNDRVELTNASWQIDARRFSSRAGIARVRLANDLTSMAYAVPVLEDRELAPLQAGFPDPTGNAALIAPGTGLGESLLHNVAGTFIPSPSEAGHADFAPRTPREIALLQDLTTRLGRASYEDVISGPGLVSIHRFTHPTPCVEVDTTAADAAANISASAMDGRCQACVEALDIFVSVLGAEAGNLALRSMATSGLYVGGGIAPRILAALRGPQFLAGFLDKAPMRDLMASIPVHVILHPDPGLLGAAVLASR
ncbi:MAG: glucokinase [Acidobacteriota bacterium]